MKGLLKSFVYAGNGILWCLKNERNMRAHFSLCVYMYAYLLFYDFFTLSKTEWAIILLVNALVFSLEIVNTAVENAVNLYGEERTEFGRISKDAAAGAVLLGAIFAVLTGIAILFQVDAFISMYEYFTENIPMLILFILSIIPASIFIFWGNPFRKGK